MSGKMYLTQSLNKIVNINFSIFGCPQHLPMKDIHWKFAEIAQIPTGKIVTILYDGSSTR